MKLKPLDFHYPNQYRYTGSNGERVLDHTLILSEVFVATHVETNIKVPCVLSRCRSDRRHDYMVLARVYEPAKTKLRERVHTAWYACGCGWVEESLTEFTAGLDYPRSKLLWIDHVSMRLRQSDWWNLWLAAAIGMRANGFTLPAPCCPFLSMEK